jgi:hypothetical protein
MAQVLIVWLAPPSVVSSSVAWHVKDPLRSAFGRP